MDYDLVVIASTITACVLGLPIVKAMVRRIERKGPAGGDEYLRADMEELRARLDAMEHVEHRLTDVEERLDFTERVLTYKKHEELPGEH